MRNWDLSINTPIQFTLAADSRFSEPDPFNDQIWDFSLAKSSPPALCMQTTYGLRARNMQVFPQFIINNQTYTDPFQFFEKPKLQFLLTNYLSLVFSPVEEIRITAEFWVVESQSIGGRFIIHNQGKKVATVQINLAAILKPLDEGESVTPVLKGTSAYLYGKTHDLVPVCMFSGNTQVEQSPYASLTQCIQIVPGKTKPITWALSSMKTLEQSSARAEEILNQNWDSEIAKILMRNKANWIDINTGDLAWDFALADSQRLAYGLILSGKPVNPGFVLARRSDMGYSFAEDGKSLSPSWKKQTALDAFHLMGFLLPGGIDLFRKILEQFLSKYEPLSTKSPSEPDSESKHQLNGKFKLDQPFLCQMAWEYFQYTEDTDWVLANMGKLSNFIKLWFDAEHDRDKDGFPEWEDLIQSGLEESPTFNRWNPETQGLDIQSVETPALGAFLYQECKCLLNLAKATGQTRKFAHISSKTKNLQRIVEECWNVKFSAFLYRDFQSHQCQAGKMIFTGNGNGQFQLSKSFSKPLRLILQIKGKEETRRKLRIVISGKNKKEEFQETLQFFDISWLHGQAYYTTANLYTRLSKVEVEGLNDEDEVVLFSADHQLQDISQLIPLFARIPGSTHAAQIIEKSIVKDYWGKYGLPISPQNTNGTFLARPPKTSILWNSLVGSGLVKYKKQNLAGELVCHIMQAVSENHQKYWGFHQYYHHQTGEPSGEMNHLHGYGPLSLFLQALGVKYIKDDHIIIRGFNPFPNPVTVKYKGTSVTRHEKDTVVTFFSGETVTITSPEPKEIRLSTSRKKSD